MSFENVIGAWRRAREWAAAGEVSATDARGAASAGLPVLAALHALADRLEQAGPHLSPAEVLAELRPVIHLATGEAQRRAEWIGHPIELPGIPSLPSGPLFEDLLENTNAPARSLAGPAGRKEPTVDHQVRVSHGHADMVSSIEYWDDDAHCWLAVGSFGGPKLPLGWSRDATATVGTDGRLYYRVAIPAQPA